MSQLVLVTFGLHLIRRYIGLHRLFLSFSPPSHWSPCTIQSCGLSMYDTISRLFHVRYDLTSLSCTISISEPPLLRYLVLGEYRSLSLGLWAIFSCPRDDPWAINGWSEAWGRSETQCAHNSGIEVMRLHSSQGIGDLLSSLSKGSSNFKPQFL